MFTYTFRNLKTMFTKQRLLSLLLVLNIVVSCLVICFSYGLYQNYNVAINDGSIENLDHVNIEIKEEYLSTEPTEPFTSEVTLEMMFNFIMTLSDETINNIHFVNFDAGYDNNLYVYNNSESGYYIQNCFLTRINSKLAERQDYKLFDDNDFATGQKVAIVGEELFENHNINDIYYVSLTSMAASGGTAYDLSATYSTFLPEECGSIEINGDQYKIINKSTDSSIYVPCTSLPLTTKISDHYFSIYFNDSMTLSDYEDIYNCAMNTMGPYVNIPDVEITDSSEVYYYKTIMLISVIIAIIASINMAILYRYILEKRSSELAIFRICGCSKGRAIVSYLLECTVINVPLFALTQLIYHKFIMPRLSELFPNMQGAYSLKLYLAIFGIYIGSSIIVMLIMITITVSKHSLIAMKNTTKATSKFGIMKVFEVVQLSAVLSMMVLIVSAIVSRYYLFTPFEEYLTRKGYMVAANNPTLYTDSFTEIINNANHIINEITSVTDGGTAFEGIAYSDEFIKAYTPPLSDGVWLCDTNLTYDNSGYIPAVITACEGRYRIGDIIENDIIIDYDENDQPKNIIKVKYKIVGILKNDISIPCYWTTTQKCLSYTDIYGVYNSQFDPRNFIFVRASDEYMCLGAHNLVWGTQFVFCDDMTDEEYAELDSKLNANVLATPLSEVRKNSLDYIYEQMYTLFPIAVCIFILTIISTVSISAIYTKRQLRNYAIFYICGARWRTCALKSLKNGAITCAVSALLSALILIIGKATLLKETVISFGIWHFAVCAGVIVLYLALSMIMPLSIIGSAEPREVLKEE